MTSTPRRFLIAILTGVLLSTVPPLVPHAEAGKLSKLVSRLRQGKEVAGIDLTLPFSVMKVRAGNSARRPDPGTKWRVSGDTVEVALDTWAAEFAETQARTIRVIYADDKPAIVIVTLKHTINTGAPYEWKELEEFEVTRLAQWSSSLGWLYETKQKDVLLNLPSPTALAAGDPNIKLVRIFSPGPWGPQVLGRVVLADTLGPKIIEAGKSQNARVVRAVLGEVERPRLGATAKLYDEIARIDPEGEYLEFDALADKATDWPTRMVVLRAVQEEYERLEQITAKEPMVPSEMRYQVDLKTARTHLTRIVRRVLPDVPGNLGTFHLLHESLVAAAFNERPDTSLAQQWADRFRPCIANLDSLAAEVPATREINPYAGRLLRALGASWKNDGAGAKASLELTIGPLDRSATTLRPITRRVQTGGWVPASSQQIADRQEFEAQRAAAPQRLAEIEAELKGIDRTAAGTEVKGAAGERVVTREVDEQGRLIGTRVQESQQNVYRTGVGKDIKARAARKEKLREERERLRALLALPAGGAPEGKVWDPRGGWLEKPGYVLAGDSRRLLDLTGDGFAMREEQASDVFVFREIREELEDPSIWGLIESRFDGRYIPSVESLRFQSVDEVVNKMLLSVIGELVDREAAKVSATEEERAWARALFGLGAPPSADLYQFIDWVK